MAEVDGGRSRNGGGVPLKAEIYVAVAVADLCFGAMLCHSS